MDMTCNVMFLVRVSGWVTVVRGFAMAAVGFLPYGSQRWAKARETGSGVPTAVIMIDAAHSDAPGANSGRSKAAAPAGPGGRPGLAS